MSKVCVINVVGLTPRLLSYAPRIQSLGPHRVWHPPIPAVTCTVQATLLTGTHPAQHGIVANGWYDRSTAEIRFWQQSNHLIEAPKLYEGIETAKMFWWFNQHAPVRWSCTPKPHYGCDGSKVFDIIDATECDLVQRLGPFPFFSFWGPRAGLPATQWIADASAMVLERNRPDLTLVYLPHLDYDFQRFSQPSMDRVREVDDCAGRVIDAAQRIGAIPVVISEYGIVPVKRSVSIQRELRRHGYLSIRKGPFGEMLIPGDSRAFAVVDHQVAHIYVQKAEDRSAVRDVLLGIDGVRDVVAPDALHLQHRRSGDWIALAQPDAWFDYYYWFNDSDAPDFARTVDIHRKPGYDPAELFMTSSWRAMARLFQKKLGFRYRMDVIPLDTRLVGGSHGLNHSPEDSPLIIGPDAPDDMLRFKDYVRSLL
ncbi:MAG: alkaline phosphatase family protein [Planctomycetota bacterium]